MEEEKKIIEDVDSDPDSSAILSEEAKIACNSRHCMLESCPHYFPHERLIIQRNRDCTERQFCSAVGICVRCEKIVSH